MSVDVAGAGMAGLLAANFLRDDLEKVFEVQRDIPNNHSAILRFRSSIVGDTLNIPFKKVTMLKAIASEGNAVSDALNYSFKTNGEINLRSIATAKGEFVERYIAPQDFITQMAKPCREKISLGTPFIPGPASMRHELGKLTISTIPMPVMMDIVNYPKHLRPKFRSIPGATITADIITPCDVHVSLYVPGPKFPFYRVSVTGAQLIIEYAFPFGDEGKTTSQEQEDISAAVHLLGFDEKSMRLGNIKFSRSSYAKILSCDDNLRKKFIIWLTDKHNIYSLGRFATWRPGLLLDDCINDLRQITTMIKNNHNYEGRMP